MTNTWPARTFPLRAARLLLWVVLFVSSGRAAAQVNAEVLRPNPLRTGLSGGVDGSFAVSRGNIELLDLGGGGRIQYQTLHPAPEDSNALPYLKQRAFLTASARFAERADTTFINQGFAHVRWSAMWHPQVGSDVFAQYQFNEFLHLRSRALTGAGIRVELVHVPMFMIWGGSGYMFEYDRIRVTPGAMDTSSTFEHRWTNYLTVRLALFDKLLVQNTVYYQPRFDKFADFRMLEELEILSQVTQVFALGTTLSILHDSAPPSGVKDTDLRLMSTVRLSL